MALMLGSTAFLVLETQKGEASTNRQSCEQIQGTEYQSWEERNWYIENCLYASVTNIQQEFTKGWIAGGGSPALLNYVHSIIHCESSWNPYADTNPPYRGLGQWDSSWYSYGGGDIYSPWQQGYNMAIRVSRDGGFGAWGCA